MRKNILLLLYSLLILLECQFQPPEGFIEIINNNIFLCRNNMIIVFKKEPLQYLGIIKTKGIANSLYWEENHFIFCDETGFTILEMNDPQNPNFIYKKALPEKLVISKRYDKRLFVASSNLIRIFDFVKINEPVKIFEIDTKSENKIIDIEFYNNNLYVLFDNGYISCFNYKNDQLLFVNKFQHLFDNNMDCQYNDVFVKNDFLYVLITEPKKVMKSIIAFKVFNNNSLEYYDIFSFGINENITISDDNLIIAYDGYHIKFYDFHREIPQYICKSSFYDFRIINSNDDKELWLNNYEEIVGYNISNPCKPTLIDKLQGKIKIHYLYE